jgi:heme A synthase
LAWATAIEATIALLLGGYVTTRRAGMADPIWPTNPWHLALIDWSEPNPAFILEHVHRLAAFVLGGLVSLLVLALWSRTPSQPLKYGGLIVLCGLLGYFGRFHGQMLAQRDELTVVWPMNTVYALWGLTGLSLLLGIYGTRWRGGSTRLLGVFTLIGVMIQGLLGGIRVRFDALLGTDLAAFHGSFAPLVFTLIICLVGLTGPVRSRFALFEPKRQRAYAVALFAFAYGQIIFGALLRHHTSSLSQRLHLFTAFVVLGLAILVIKSLVQTPELKNRFKIPARFLMGLLGIQILLGVEAWVGKFGLGIPADLDRLTTGKAIVRTLHTHLGAWLLALSGWVMIVFLTQSQRKASSEAVNETDSPEPEWNNPKFTTADRISVGGGV